MKFITKIEKNDVWVSDKTLIRSQVSSSRSTSTMT